MTSFELATIVATYLTDRDDIAKAEVIEDLDGVVSALVTTQGGQRFAFAVEPAEV